MNFITLIITLYLLKYRLGTYVFVFSHISPNSNIYQSFSALRYRKIYRIKQFVLNFITKVLSVSQLVNILVVFDNLIGNRQHSLNILHNDKFREDTFDCLHKVFVKFVARVINYTLLIRRTESLARRSSYNKINWT